jgi:5'-nucleotidase
VRHAYDDALYTRYGSGSDGVIISAGTLRGDSVYPPGKRLPLVARLTPTEVVEGEITLGDILEILPFEDPTVVLELDGEALWDALEAGLSKYPAQEG